MQKASDTAAGMLAEYLRDGDPFSEGFSLQELEILHLIAQGLTNKEIGNQLHLSENTVKG